MKKLSLIFISFILVLISGLGYANADNTNNSSNKNTPQTKEENSPRKTFGGGRLYGPDSYYEIYNQLCPDPMRYIDMETMLKMLEEQDNDLCAGNKIDNQNEDLVDSKNPKEDKEDIDKGKNNNGEEDNIREKIKKNYLEKIKIKKGDPNSGIKTYPKEGGFCIDCIKQEDGSEPTGRITLFQDSIQLKGIGKEQFFDEYGNLIKEEIRDYIHLTPEKLKLYLNEKEIEDCKK